MHWNGPAVTEAFYFAQDWIFGRGWQRSAKSNIPADELYEVRFTIWSITARQTARQAALRQLIAEATRDRARPGQSDVRVLARAAAVRQATNDPQRRVLADIDYFLGSCLASRGDLCREGLRRRRCCDVTIHGQRRGANDPLQPGTIPVAGTS